MPTVVSALPLIDKLIIFQFKSSATNFCINGSFRTIITIDVEPVFENSLRARYVGTC